MTAEVESCEAIIARHSKSFALAARLLPSPIRRDTAVVYAWCRRADDLVDTSTGQAQRLALFGLKRELAALYSGAPAGDPVADAFGEVVRARGIPERYPSELLAGMELDVRGVRYDRVEQLLEYCYRVASTVGLMMCHVMGVSDARALRHAVHLGIALQLTNICRDVMEDWQRGRLYLPADVLSHNGVARLRQLRGGSFPKDAVPGCRLALRELLALAERYYASGDAGLCYLTPRCAFAIAAARRIYSAIGRVIAHENYDVRAPRAVVPLPGKLLCALMALLSVAAARPNRASYPASAQLLPRMAHASDLVAL